MIPKKASSIYRQVAEDINLEESVIADIVEYYYKELRINLTSLTYPRINVEGLGHFVAKPLVVKADIPKITEKLQSHDTSTFGAYFNKKGLELKLEQLLELEKKILKEDERKDNFKKTKNESSTEDNLGE
jgi:hypothetical protein